MRAEFPLAREGFCIKLLHSTLPLGRLIPARSGIKNALHVSSLRGGEGMGGGIVVSAAGKYTDVPRESA